MHPVHIHEAVPGNLPQPWIKGNWRLGKILRQPSKCVSHGFLNNIGRIDSRRNSFVQPYDHHPPQSLAVPIQQLGPSCIIPTGSPLNERLDLTIHVFHKTTSLLAPGAAANRSPAFSNAVPISSQKGTLEGDAANKALLVPQSVYLRW
jgi:hypothetical protein